MTDLAEVQNLQGSLSVTLAVTPDIQSELAAGRTALEIAQSYVIDSPTMAQEASDELQRCNARKKKFEALQKTFIEPAQKIIENARGLFRPAIEANDQAAQVLKIALGTWTEKENARIERERAEREALERKARQEAEAKAAAELARAQEQARQAEEQARREAEARARAEAEANAAAEARRKAIEEGNKEAARKAADDERRAREEAQARAAAEAKSTEKASAAIENGTARATEAHMTAAAVVSAPAPAVQKVAGFTMRDNWEGVLAPKTTADDAKKAIIEAAAAGRTDLYGLLIVDDKAIDKLAKALKSSMNIPGYVAVNNPKPVAARR